MIQGIFDVINRPGRLKNRPRPSAPLPCASLARGKANTRMFSPVPPAGGCTMKISPIEQAPLASRVLVGKPRVKRTELERLWDQVIQNTRLLPFVTFSGNVFVSFFKSHYERPHFDWRRSWSFVKGL